MTKYVAYYRVSTQRQGRSGLGLQAQQATVATYLRDSKPVAEFCEVESGRDDHRPELAKALASCRVHKATLVIAKLDRLSRNLSFLGQMMESKQPFVCCDMPDANHMTIGIMASVAAGEAKMISERTKLALAAAKRKGTTLGGDRGKQTRSQLLAANRASAAVRSEAARQRAADLQPIIAELRSAGARSLAAIAARLNERGITTARGGAWSAAQVYRITALP
jgi:DNA invertase Pin-like site-specific DNA recombinase